MSLLPAIYSGLCASFASLFGKLSGLELIIFKNVQLRFAANIICLVLMVFLNSLVWTFFVKALQSCKTAVEATAVSTATNYILSGILGFVVFGEVTGFLWWCGVSLIITGIVIINSSDNDTIKEKKKN